MNVTFDIKKLASSLAKLNKQPKDQRPTSYQDYLQVLSKIAGVSGYEAFEALWNKSPSQHDSKGRLVAAQYTSEWGSGHIITTSCKLNLQSFEVTDIVQADTSNDLESLIDEYVSFEGTKYLIVHDPCQGNSEVGDLRTFAFSCFNDFYAAVEQKIQAFESAKLFRINGVPCQYSIDGDWGDCVLNIFENSTSSEELSNSLSHSCVWHPEGMDTDSYAKYEWFFDAVQLLFSDLQTQDGVKKLIVNEAEGENSEPIVIEFLS